MSTINFQYALTADDIRRAIDALERIAAAMERAYPLDLRDSGLTRASDDAVSDEDPKVPDPLDESDHRPRHGRGGGHWAWRQADLWCPTSCSCPHGTWTLPEIDGNFGPLTFCDCPDPLKVES